MPCGEWYPFMIEEGSRRRAKSNLSVEAVFLCNLFEGGYLLLYRVAA